LGPRKADWAPWGLSALPHGKRGTRLAGRRCPNQKIERDDAPALLRPNRRRLMPAAAPTACPTMRRRLQTYEATSAEGTGRPPKDRWAAVGPPEASPTGQPFALVPKESRRRIVAPAARAGWVADKFPDAVLIHLGHTTGVRTQIAKTTPCKVEWPGSQHSGRLRPGHEMVRRHGTTHLLQSPAMARGRGACPVCANEESGRVRAPMQVRSRFQCGDGSGPPCRSPNCCAPGMQRAPLHGKGAATVERRYETRPRRAAVTASDRWNCHPSDK
jgi:hypothetical protein